MSVEALARVFGADVTATAPLHGGDLSEVLRITFADGRSMAVKRGPRVDTEARMLAAMATAGAPVPQVLHQAGDLLCLEWLDEGTASPEGWEALGRGLRTLHNCTGTSYGWPEDYGFGPVPIANETMADWPEFWARRRLLPFLPSLPMALARRLEALARALPERLPARVEERATEMEARRLAQDVALAVQAALLAQTAPTAVFGAFCESRLGGQWGHSFGSLGAGTDFDAIIHRALPH